MRTVVFYISGHGFGHASRQVEIIHALAAQEPDVRILIRSDVSPALLHRTLRVPCDVRPGACDTGIVQRSSVVHDHRATTEAAIAFYRDADAWVDREVRALADDAIALVVADIPPLAFDVADRVEVPGVAIGNFTWDWIYETHPGLADAAPWLIPRLRTSYRRASGALALPFSGGFEVFANVTPLPLVARRATRARADTRLHFGIPADRPAVLLSFGGYGLPELDPGSADCRPDWTIVTTDRTSGSTARLPGVVIVPESAFIDSGFRYEDLVGASDVVLTKPGYGIIAECISTSTAMLYTSRGPFREYDLLVSEMPRYLRCRFLSGEKLLAGRWLRDLEALVRQPRPSEQRPADGADAAARALSAWLAASR
jgi:hypothetical protein